MKILKIWDSEYPWDVRAEKVCRSLTRMGHEVRMLARNREGRTLVEELDECIVHRMRPWSGLGHTLNAASQFPAFFNPRWVRFIRSSARKMAPDVILVRDLPLAPTAIHVGSRLGIPVVLDMAENYPAMIRDLWTTDNTRFGDRLIRNPRAVEWVERWVLNEIDHVVVVVEESRDRLLRLGVPASRITVVSNTPSLSRLEEFQQTRVPGNGKDWRNHLSEEELSPNDGEGVEIRLKLVYLGLMEEARGVGTAIEGMALARKSGRAATLDLIGDGRSLESFRELAKAVGLSSEEVRFHGFVPYEDALSRVAQADVGLIPHFANESWETTIPNKLFDYMSLGVPVLASDVTPVKRVLGETKAGWTFRDRDADDFARVLTGIEASDCRKKGSAGLKAIRNRYNWEVEAEALESALIRTTEAARR